MNSNEHDVGVTPRPASPFNRRLRAHGHTQPPTGPMRGHHVRHFAWQQRIGLFLTLLIFFATVYGVTRDFGRTFLFLGGIVTLIAVLQFRARMRSPYSRWIVRRFG